MNLQRDWAFYATSFKQSIAYRSTMLFSLITGPLTILANYAIWQGIFAASGKTIIGGYTFEQMVAYIAVAMITMYLTWDDTDVRIREAVRDGSLTTHLLRPVSYLWTLFLNKLGNRTLAALIEYLPVVFILTLLLGKKILTGNVGLYAAAVAIAFVISFLIRALLGMLAFYFVRPRGMIEIYNIISTFLYGTFLPLALFPHAVQRVFLFLPFQFVSYVPAQLFMGEYRLGSATLTPAQLFLLGIGHIIILIIILAIVWRASVKRFCGVGT